MGPHGEPTQYACTLAHGSGLPELHMVCGLCLEPTSTSAQPAVRFRKSCYHELTAGSASPQTQTKKMLDRRPNLADMVILHVLG